MKTTSRGLRNALTWLAWATALVAGPAAALAQVNITLRPSATVAPALEGTDGPRGITLGEVADFDPANAPEATSLSGVAVSSGRAGVEKITIAQVQAALDQAKVNWGRLSLRGSTCRIFAGAGRGAGVAPAPAAASLALVSPRHPAAHRALPGHPSAHRPWGRCGHDARRDLGPARGPVQRRSGRPAPGVRSGRRAIPERVDHRPARGCAAHLQWRLRPNADERVCLRRRPGGRVPRARGPGPHQSRRPHGPPASRAGPDHL